jgi:hypothetical protein
MGVNLESLPNFIAYSLSGSSHITVTLGLLPRSRIDVIIIPKYTNSCRALVKDLLLTPKISFALELGTTRSVFVCF